MIFLNVLFTKKELVYVCVALIAYDVYYLVVDILSLYQKWEQTKIIFDEIVVIVFSRVLIFAVIQLCLR